MSSVAVGVLVASLLNGLRHGFDIDHLAAIADITGAGSDRRRGLVAATVYALGHALVVLVLGLAAVLLGAQIPTGIESAMTRVVGGTLLLLGLYVVYSIVRYRRNVRLHSRWTLVRAGLRWLWGRVHRSFLVVIEHEHAHAHEFGFMHSHPPEELSAATPDPPPTGPSVHSHPHAHVGIQSQDRLKGYSLAGALVVGMLHGVGAETPTQLLLFATVAGTGSNLLGVMVVGAFLLGLVASNTLMAIVTSFGFAEGRRLPILYMGLATITAVFSLAVGTAYLFGG